MISRRTACGAILLALLCGLAVSSGATLRTASTTAAQQGSAPRVADDEDNMLVSDPESSSTSALFGSLADGGEGEDGGFESADDGTENNSWRGAKLDESSDSTTGFEEQLALGGESGFLPPLSELNKMVPEVLNDPAAKGGSMDEARKELKTKLSSLKQLLMETKNLMARVHSNAPASDGSDSGSLPATNGVKPIKKHKIGEGLEAVVQGALHDATMELEEDSDDDDDDTGDDGILKNDRELDDGRFGSDAAAGSASSVTADVRLSDGDMGEEGSTTSGDSSGDDDEEFNPDDAYSSRTRAEVHEAASELRAQLKPLISEVVKNATTGHNGTVAAAPGAPTANATPADKQADLKKELEAGKMPMPEIPNTPTETFDNASRSVEAENWSAEIGLQAESEKALSDQIKDATAADMQSVNGTSTPTNETSVAAEQAKENEVALRLGSMEKKNEPVPEAADKLRGVVQKAVGVHAKETRAMVEELEDKIATMHQDTEDETDAKINKLAEMVEAMGQAPAAEPPADEAALKRIASLKDDVENLSHAFEKHQAELRKKGGGPKFMAPGNPTVAPLIDVLKTTVGIITGKPDDDREKQVDPDVNNMVEVLKKAIYHVANVTQPEHRQTAPKGVDPKTFQNILQSTINDAVGSSIQDSILKSVEAQKEAILKSKEDLKKKMADQSAAAAAQQQQQQNAKLAAEAEKLHLNATTEGTPAAEAAEELAAAEAEEAKKLVEDGKAKVADDTKPEAKPEEACDEDIAPPSGEEEGCVGQCKCQCCQCHNQCKMKVMSALMDMLEGAKNGIIEAQRKNKASKGRK